MIARLMSHARRNRLGGETSAVRVALALLALLAAVGVFGSRAPMARADGDPASDVLVARTLFLPSDAHASAAAQAQVQGLLRAAGHAGFPIQVAVIASGYDLGSVTALWHRPRVYARFLGVELSLVHRQPLLVVMPDGFGFSWPGHATAAAYRLLSRIPIGSGGAGLITATRTAVHALAAANGSAVAAAAPSAGRASGHHSRDDAPAIAVAAASCLAGVTGDPPSPPGAGGRCRASRPCVAWRPAHRSSSSASCAMPPRRLRVR
jgi:hypothetical protein